MTTSTGRGAPSRRLRGVLSFAALAICALFGPACGKGGGGTATSTPTVTGALAVTMSTPTGTQGGLVPLQYTLSDSFGTTAMITVEFSTDGFVNDKAAT